MAKWLREGHISAESGPLPLDESRPQKPAADFNLEDADPDPSDPSEPNTEFEEDNTDAEWEEADSSPTKVWHPGTGALISNQFRALIDKVVEQHVLELNGKPGEEHDAQTLELRSRSPFTRPDLKRASSLNSLASSMLRDRRSSHGSFGDFQLRMKTAEQVRRLYRSESPPDTGVRWRYQAPSPGDHSEFLGRMRLQDQGSRFADTPRTRSGGLASGDASFLLSQHPTFARQHGCTSSEDAAAFRAYEDAERRLSVTSQDLFDQLVLGESSRADLAKQRSQMTRFQRVGSYLESTQYEVAIASFLMINVLWMAMELQLFGTTAGFRLQVESGPIIPSENYSSAKNFFIYGDMVFNSVFALDVFTRIIFLGLRFWKSILNYVDVLVTAASIVESYFLYTSFLPIRSVVFRLLRVGKLVRAVRMVGMTSMLTSLHLLLKCLASSRAMLFWSFCLLAFVQCLAGLVVSILCQDFIEDPSQDRTLRENVYRYYGTFTRTFLTMFEILFANWSPPCRVVVENISELFSIFFLLYRCVLGFAVLNVVNAVFVQQTMKTAESDEELAFRQKQKDSASYARKVKKLFQSMDVSGDGAINLEEFSKLVASPKLKFWMGQLELEYHDLLSLFEFLANGDGEITLHEFIDGAAKLRGSAKAIDIWRIETKVEVLFEEVLAKISSVSSPLRDTKPTVQEAFENSPFRHMKSTRQGSSTTPTRPLSKAASCIILSGSDEPDEVKLSM
mmetsp:Transcript_41501/g.96560  ORF Transcript_41501/g.96560 Transcript_41501/m.96560 type:complete len:734 (+) Transcript_41501:67-2268(+)